MDLNRFIADRVMNKSWIKPNHGIWCACQKCGYEYESCQCVYTEDIEMAFEVVKRMRELGFCYKINAADSGKTRVSFWKSEYDAHGVADDFLPTAICLAAKAALEEEA